MTNQVPKAMTSLCLRDKVIIVTGGNSGIGQSIVEAVGGLGAKVVIDYRSHPERTEELIEEIGELGGQAIGVQADVAKLDDLQRLIDTAVKTFGKIDRSEEHTELQSLLWTSYAVCCLKKKKIHTTTLYTE